MNLTVNLFCNYTTVHIVNHVKHLNKQFLSLFSETTTFATVFYTTKYTEQTSRFVFYANFN